MAVRAVSARRRDAKVYNLRVADYHTYFVQAPGGGAWLWAHNAYVLPKNAARVSGRFPRTAKAGQVLYRTGANGKVTNYQVYNRLGLPVKRVDLVGKAHGGVPTPHVAVYIHNKAPGGLIPTLPKKVRSAFPWEIVQ